MIKRFTGGGTVVVDRDTQFVSIILNRDAVPGLELFPAPLMRWTGELYGGEQNPHAVFRDVPGWRLRENDYVVGDLKVGGNAQSIAKDRWLRSHQFPVELRTPSRCDTSPSRRNNRRTAPDATTARSSPRSQDWDWRGRRWGNE